MLLLALLLGHGAILARSRRGELTT